MNLRQRMITFMQGRYITYGADSLSKFLFSVMLFFIILNIFAKSIIVSILVWTIFVYAYYRLLSKNIYNRYQENEAFEKHKNSFICKLNRFSCKVSEYKRYHIYKCPDCGQKIRIPRGRGKIIISCPKCHNEFIKKSWSHLL